MEDGSDQEMRRHFAEMAEFGLCRDCGRIGAVARCAQAVVAGLLQTGDPIPDAVMEDGAFFLCEGCFLQWWKE